jgi:hypothetical protein
MVTCQKLKINYATQNVSVKMEVVKNES